MWYSALGCIVTCILSLLAAPRATEAQMPPHVYRIGVLSATAPTPAALRRHEAFRQALRDLGYVDGQNIAIERRHAEGRFARLPDFAVELVGLHVDVFVASGSESVAAVQHTTKTIPIVMTHVGDPVQRGFVASLARPGGNITGLATAGDDLIGKQLELLREAVPQLSRLAVLWNPPQPAHTPFLKTLEAVAGAVGIALRPVAVHRSEDFEGAFAAMRAVRAEALMLTGSGLHYQHLRQIADLARASGLPAIAWERAFAEGGLFMTYGPDEEAIFRRAAYYIDRILKGTKPTDLPVERPMKFELVLNLKTAKALGLTIPRRSSSRPTRCSNRVVYGSCEGMRLVHRESPMRLRLLGASSRSPWGTPSRTTHLRSSSQEECDVHEGLFAAKANSGERFFRKLSKYLTSL
jgi:putative tryptophan/tyrosine transport system substrate-binding protein